MAINSYLSALTLNISGLNAPIKRHRVTEWVRKQDPSICCLQETHFRPKDTIRLKVRGWICIFSDNNVMKLKINHKKKFGKTTNTWRLKNIILKNEWANQEVKEEIKKYMEANENVNTTAQNL